METIRNGRSLRAIARGAALSLVLGAAAGRLDANHPERDQNI